MAGRSATSLTALAVRQHRLAQIYDRDQEAEGSFWYSVVTTGFYCRPACPSRRARPENIRLHETLEEARATGLRACARCLPEGPSTQDRQRALVETACQRITAGGEVPSSRDLAHALGLSPSHFYRLFRRITGMTPSAYTRSACDADTLAGADCAE